MDESLRLKLVGKLREIAAADYYVDAAHECRVRNYIDHLVDDCLALLEQPASTLDGGEADYCAVEGTP
jgi:ketosteroid isomerase-like protein